MCLPEARSPEARPRGVGIGLHAALARYSAARHKRGFLFQNPHVLRDTITTASWPARSNLSKSTQNALHFENF